MGEEALTQVICKNDFLKTNSTGSFVVSERARFGGQWNTAQYSSFTLLGKELFIVSF